MDEVMEGVEIGWKCLQKSGVGDQRGCDRCASRQTNTNKEWRWWYVWTLDLSLLRYTVPQATSSGRNDRVPTKRNCCKSTFTHDYARFEEGCVAPPQQQFDCLYSAFVVRTGVAGMRVDDSDRCPFLGVFFVSNSDSGISGLSS